MFENGLAKYLNTEERNDGKLLLRYVLRIVGLFASSLATCNETRDFGTNDIHFLKILNL